MQSLSLFILSLLLFNPRLQAQKTKSKTFHYTDNFDQDLSKQPTKAQKALHLMYGHYSNKKLADELQNPKYSHQESIVVPMWQEKRKGEHWFYGLWFAGNFYDKPLMEIFCSMENIGRDSFNIKIFKATTSSRLYEWQLENPYQDLSPKDLIHHEGCTHLGVWSEQEQTFYWIVNETCQLGLTDQMTGIKLLTNFTPKGLYGYPKYYDKNGKLIFAYPEDQGTFFERLDTKPKKRRNK